MNLAQLSDYTVLVAFALLLVRFSGPPLVLVWLWWGDTRQSQHAVLRNFPLLGRLRYLFEQIGPELCQYLCNADLEGYLRNDLFPTQMGELGVELEPRVRTCGYILEDEGRFRRQERLEEREMAPWTLAPGHRPVLGADLPHPWELRGLVGMSGMSFGALGRNAIRTLSEGLGAAHGA